MPDLAVFHPQIVHFVIAFLILGVVARVLSLLPLGERFRFLGPMATVLIILGTLAAWAAFKSGMDAHGPVERVPGVRDAVVEHEDWGKRARNLFIAVGVLELAALALSSRRRLARGILAVSALAGLAGLWVIYETAEHGGDLVYNYAGGVGIRSGAEGDVKRLLVAGLYHNARIARDAGRKEEAGRLTEELMRQLPEDANVRFLGVESRVKDHEDPRGALEALAAIQVPGDDWRLNLRKAALTAEAYRAVGAADSAQAALDDLKARFPDHPRIKAALERMAQPPGGGR
jgi:uncharacterized membrane protein